MTDRHTSSGATIIAVANQKGGVAKTTTAIHIGVALAELGKRVLLVDLDPQGHLAEGFGMVSDDLETEISDVLEGTKRIADVIIPNVRQNLDLAPSNIRLADMELTLVGMHFREHKLRRLMEPVVHRYDYILMDCPPNLGLLTFNGLMAAQEVLIPMTTQFRSLLGLSRLLKTIQRIQSEGNPDLHILGIVPTRYRANTVHSREVVQRVKEELGDQFTIFEPPVPEATKFDDASGLGKTMFDIAGDSPGAQIYRALAERIARGR